MNSARALRQQIETTLAHRIPSALSPAPRTVRPVAPVGIGPIDDLLRGGFPVGAITEISGPECAGRTSLSLSFLANLTQSGKVCAWVDASDTLHPESAAASGIELARLLWVRCGVARETGVHRVQSEKFTLPSHFFSPPPIKRGLHGGGHGPHPRDEEKGLSNGISGLFKPELILAHSADAQKMVRHTREIPTPTPPLRPLASVPRSPTAKPWTRVEQALRVTDLLLQAGGFSAIILDLAGIAPEFASRVPLATWFRYRAAAERTQSSILLLTQSACAKSSAALVLRLDSACPAATDTTFFSGLDFRVEAARERFLTTPTNVIPMRKASQSERAVAWQTCTPWAGRR